MSHEFDTGFTVREPAWHGLGNLLAAAPTNIIEAREAAGLTWEPRKVPAYQKKRELVGVTVEGEIVERDIFVEVEGAALIERTDTDAVIGHGVSSDYQPISNQTMFEVCEALASEGAVWETAGSLRGGSIVWSLMKLDEPFTLPGDNSISHPFVSVVNFHDGSGAMRAQSGSIRIVCQNTNNAADWQAKSRQTQFVFRHTANVEDRINEARQVIMGSRSEAAEWQELAEELLGIPVTTGNYNAFLDEFFPLAPGVVHSDRVLKNWEGARGIFTQCYNGETNAAAHGTALGLMNCATEYLDHLRAYKSKDTYVTRTLLRPEPLKAKALQIIKAVCV